MQYDQHMLRQKRTIAEGGKSNSERLWQSASAPSSVLRALLKVQNNKLAPARGNDRRIPSMRAMLTGAITRELLRELKSKLDDSYLEDVVRAHGVFVRKWFWNAWKMRDETCSAAQRAQ